MGERVEHTAIAYKLKKEEISDEWRELMEEAERRVVVVPYAPYSDFRVVAAALTADGRVYWGVNQENASLPAGLCAERVAVAAALSGDAGYGVDVVFKCAWGGGQGKVDVPLMPCGVCRQFLFECEERQGRELRVVGWMKGAEHVWMVERVKELLPWGFGPGYLRRKS